MQNKCKTVGKVRPYLNITSLEAMVPTKSVSDKVKVLESHTKVAKHKFFCQYLLSRIKQSNALTSWELIANTLILQITHSEIFYKVITICFTDSTNYPPLNLTQTQQTQS